jgi:hypothetical protein
MNSPVVQTVEGFVVVRDDLIPGGTKQRVIPAFLQAGEAGEYVYASPAYGYAQIALAHACRAQGRRATVFVAKRKTLHARTAEAARAGATIVEVPYGYLTNVQAKARAYAEATGASLLPFGFDFPAFVEGLADVARATGLSPAEVWCAAGSGTLTRALQAAWPQARHHAVEVGAKADIGRARRHVCNLPFEKDAKARPPFPSCSNYDAKVWAFMRAEAAPGALFWNVAG